MESAVDSSFFWGYLVTQIPGGFLASIYPANRIFGTAIACSAFLNLFLPGAFEFPGIIICIRVLQGLVEVRKTFLCPFSWLKRIFVFIVSS
jgi:ACS family sodium-dependent inorganic phosphate cotransporter-like MFS transporter 6/7/8